MTGDRRARPGFYGKLPVLGDFVTRRLPHAFIGAWDAWLQSAMAASREALDARWLETYLTSPIWRFALSPGLCGPAAWAGLLMPSVDRVGRYFPLTVAAPIERADRLPYVFTHAQDWFSRLEAIALSGLEDQFKLDVFDAHLSALELPSAFFSGGAPRRAGEASGKIAFQCALDDLDGTADGFVGISAGLLRTFMPGFSLWSTSGSEFVEPSLLLCEGLPPLTAYAGMMNGEWRTQGWRVECEKVLPSPRRLPAQLGAIPPKASPDCTAPAVEPKAAPWSSHGRSEVGGRRTFNEDAILSRPDARLWAVADGMGGHDAGDVASRRIVEALQAVEPVEPLESYLMAVGRALQEVNGGLRAMAAERFGGRIVGSTVVVLLGDEGRCAFAWAGDSRLYRLRDGRLSQMTQDHSGEDLDRDELPAEIQHWAMKSSNVITRAVGADDALELDSEICDVRDGDVFLLCSDGLDKEVNPYEIEHILKRCNARDSVDELVALALSRGARDNVSVIVVRV